MIQASVYWNKKYWSGRFLLVRHYQSFTTFSQHRMELEPGLVYLSLNLATLHSSKCMPLSLLRDPKLVFERQKWWVGWDTRARYLDKVTDNLEVEIKSSGNLPAFQCCKSDWVRVHQTNYHHHHHHHHPAWELIFENFKSPMLMLLDDLRGKNSRSCLKKRGRSVKQRNDGTENFNTSLIS